MRNFNREPIALFRQIKEKKKSNKLLHNLKSTYPRELKIGATIKAGDCFFDSVAQGLNELNIKPDHYFTAKSLRKDCTDYVEQHGKQDSWAYKAVIKDAAIGDYFVALEGPYGPIQDPKTKVNVIDEEKTFHEYLKDIKNMVIESGSPPIWGRPNVEGRMICEKYKVKIEVIALEEPIDGRYTTQFEQGEGDKVVRIVNYMQHFVPPLSGISKDIIENQPVSNEEILETGKRVPSSNQSEQKAQQEEIQKKLINSYKREAIYSIAAVITAITFTASAIAAVFTQSILLACLAGVALATACICVYQLTQSHKDIHQLKSEPKENIAHTFLEEAGLKIYSLIDKVALKA